MRILTKDNQLKYDTGDLDIKHFIERNVSVVTRDFKNIKLESFYISDADFTGVILDGSILHNIIFSNCNLKYANFINANLEKVSFNNCILDNTYFNNAKLKNTSFNNCIIKNSNFMEAELNNIDFSYSNLEEANFKNAKMGKKVNFQHTKLLNANLDNIDFDGKKIDFRYAIGNGKEIKSLQISGHNIVITDTIICIDYIQRERKCWENGVIEKILFFADKEIHDFWIKNKDIILKLNDI